MQNIFKSLLLARNIVFKGFEDLKSFDTAKEIYFL